MVDVPPGATTVPPPVNIDLNDLMRKHPLITDFPPLPSRDLIIAASQQQPPPSGPSAFPLLPVIDLLGGVTVGPRGPRNPPGHHPPPTNNPPGRNPPSSTDPHGTTTGQGPKGPKGPVVGPSRTTPTPPPVILRQTPKPKPTPIKKKPNQPNGPR
jgi:hypothetical protein